jgi:RNA polymerase subunit RPABC4/transcription elongation factor Spt4
MSISHSCPHCERLLPRDAQLCPTCGHSTNRPCPHCKKLTDCDAKLCSHCHGEIDSCAACSALVSEVDELHGLCFSCWDYLVNNHNRGRNRLTFEGRKHARPVGRYDCQETDIRITPLDARLGKWVEVPTAKGLVKVHIPGGVSNGQRLRLRGAGDHDSSGGRSDHFINVTVLPQQVSPQHGLPPELIGRNPQEVAEYYETRNEINRRLHPSTGDRVLGGMKTVLFVGIYMVGSMLVLMVMGRFLGFLILSIIALYFLLWDKTDTNDSGMDHLRGPD